MKKMRCKILDWMNLSLTRLDIEKALDGTDLAVAYRTGNGNLVIFDDLGGAVWEIEKEKNSRPGVIRYKIDPAFESFLVKYFRKDLRA